VGPRKFQFKRTNLNYAERHMLQDFWSEVQGPWKSFTYSVPNADGTTTATSVVFENEPLSLKHLTNAVEAGLTFVENFDPTTAPIYTVASTCVRFPSLDLQSALLSQDQELIPLIHIRPVECNQPGSTLPDNIYLSDRRCTVGSQLYLARVLDIGDSKDVLLSQSLSSSQDAGGSDTTTFVFANADRVMTQLAADTDLTNATIDLCLYHVNTETLIQLWSGFIVPGGFVSDGTEKFTVRASDGLYQTTLQYPNRVVSRSCWKTFSDGLHCPYASAHTAPAPGFAAGSPLSCDYMWDSVCDPSAGENPDGTLIFPGGCLAHGMWPYFGGHPAQPQGVRIKDNTTGIWGIGRSMITATSIISDTVWGQALPEIWCNYDGDASRSFIAKALLIAGRDESDFYDALGIIGLGPIGLYTPMTTFQNLDGFRYIIAPMLDGQTAIGFTVNGNTQILTNSQSGLRQSVGNDPPDIVDNWEGFSLSQAPAGATNGSPWPSPTLLTGAAAGTAFTEIRRTDPSGVQPSLLDQHDMEVPIALGLSGRTWDASGNPSWVAGMRNPFWIAVNSFLRAIGLAPQANDSSTTIANQLSKFVLSSVYVGDGSGTAEIADTLVSPIVQSQSDQIPIGATLPITGITCGNPTIFSAPSTSGMSTGDMVLILGTAVDMYGNPGGWWGGVVGAQWTITVLDGTRFCVPGLNSNSQNMGKAGIKNGSVQLYTPANGNELQFQFQGCLSQQKPFRDWLTEILAVGLGYYTWEFGKLKLGCRWNAVPTDAFTLGNMLFQSLTLRPIEPTFEHLLIDYADVAYQYQLNTAEYQDKTHASYYGRAGSPLTKRQHSVGCSTLSQALRLAAIRTREELGGVNVAEWTAARQGQFGTTILALNTEVGQVVSLTHPDLVSTTNPTGYGVFRIVSWRLMKDWSVQIGLKTVTPSMYDLTQGPPVTGTLPLPLPGMNYPIPSGPAWAPYQIQAPANDALFPGEWNFASDQEYPVEASGAATAELVVTGKLPVNEFSPVAVVPPIIGGITESTTGGSIPGGVTLRVAVCAVDASGLPSPPSAIAIVQIPPGTNTNSFSLTNIIWPAVAGLTGYFVFVSTQDDLICAQSNGGLTAGANFTYTPGTLNMGGPFTRSTWALPSPNVARVRVKAKLSINNGVAGVEVMGITSGNIQSDWLIDTSPPATPFNPVGRIVSVIGRPTGLTPFASFNITGYDAATGTLTVSPDPTATDPNTGQPFVRVGDAIVIRNLADAANTANPTQITDSGYKNVTSNYTGLVPGSLVGCLIRVIAGTGRGTPPRNIVANTATQITWDLPMPMDHTSVWIVEEPTWSYSADSTSIDNGSPATPVSISVPAGNFLQQPVVIAGFTVDVNGVESSDGDAPIREDWIYGAQGTRTITASSTMLATDGLVLCDTTAGDLTYTMLPFSEVPNQEVLVVKVTGDTNTVAVQTTAGDTFDDGSTQITLTFLGAYTVVKIHG
jgi:hypothetical protein